MADPTTRASSSHGTATETEQLHETAPPTDGSASEDVVASPDSAVVLLNSSGSQLTTTEPSQQQRDDQDPSASNSSPNQRERVSSVLSGLGFLVNTARIISEVSFATAKAGTSVGIGIARGIVNGVGDATGDPVVAPLISSTLNFAERVAQLGIDTGRFWTRFGLDAAKISLGSIDHLVGSTDTARAISEFAKLVQAELARTIDIGEEDDGAPAAGAITDSEWLEDAVVLSGGDQSAGNNERLANARRTLSEIGFVDTVRAITAWVCLMRLTRAEWENRALNACSQPLGFSAANQPSPDVATGSGPRIVEIVGDFDYEINLDEVVFELVSDTTSGQVLDVVLAHVGEAGETSSSSPNRPEIDNVPILVRQLRRYMKFATGSYGKTVVNFLFGGDPITLGDVIAQTQSPGGRRDREFFARHTEVHNDDVYHTSYRSRENFNARDGLIPYSRLPNLLPENNTHYQPTFYIIMDHHQKTIVVSLRGTLSLHDAMVDLTCGYSAVVMHGETYLVHSGMHRAALRVALPSTEWLEEVSRARSSDSPTSIPNLSSAARPPGVFEAVRAGILAFPSYSITLTGHSLGAGIAALLALHWGDPTTGRLAPSSGLPGVGVVPLHCYAFASPAIIARSQTSGVGGTTWASGFESLITTVVTGDDLVPRLSLGSVRDLAGAAAWMHLHRNTVAAALIGQAMSFDPPRRDSDGSVLITDGNGGEISANAVLDRIRSRCFKADKLYPTGRILWIKNDETNASNYSGSNRSSCSIREVLRPEDGVLDGLVFSSSMMADHMPQNCDQFVQSFIV
ncbi:hypothetical protein DFJ73DRAFT_809679 [Zopfochytrium polystomum]|nr:hypothetical protein DFJ73DRAFT_809679 [Zopfochytrium polystomum]